MNKFGFLVLVIFLANVANAQEIIAHRGASYIAPENTLASVRLGYELRADAVEIDVHLSKDKRIMVNHDKSAKRTGGQNLIIRDTHSRELRKLDVGAWKDEKYKGEKMPFLKEVLRLIPKDKKLIIEIKSDPEILPYLVKQVRRYKDNIVFISFNFEAVTGAKRLMPEVPAYWLLGNFKTHTPEEAIRLAQENRLNGLNVNYNLATQEFKDKMNAAGLETYTYTVNDPAVARRLSELNVKGITTDRPDWMRSVIGNR